MIKPDQLSTNLLASWRSSHGHRLGLLPTQAQSSTRLPSLETPTRAHGLLVERSGSVIALARRPGDWLLRWHPGTGLTQWHWMEGDSRFNGHACVGTGPHGKPTLWTTETDLASADGWLGVRDPARLGQHAAWATHGRDPHAVLTLPQPVGKLPRGTLMVANGGIATLPETGRMKNAVEQMDASLVALSHVDGRLLGQWRLADPYLSVRHLAWNPLSHTLGVALQAEHPHLATREAAPVFACWTGEALVPATNQPALKGYGGDICALPNGGFVVSCPRADTLALFNRTAGFDAELLHPNGCALAALGQRWWAGGRDAILQVDLNSARSLIPLQLQDPSAPQPDSLVLDNHCALWPQLAQDFTGVMRTLWA